MEARLSTKARIEEKLRAALTPERIEVIDESHLHAGHAHHGSDHHSAFDGSGETHFRVRVISERFAGMGRVERHRVVNQLLAEELAADVHALAIEPAAPGEKTRW
jgi:BolA family transcriptional regulator, general stress-responsive regulator